MSAVVKDGRLRPLAVTTAKRDPQFPEVPTMQEAGVADFDADIWYGLALPAETPGEVIDKISADLKNAVDDPEVQAKLRQNGLEPAYLNSQVMADLVKRDAARWKDVATRINLQLD